MTEAKRTQLKQKVSAAQKRNAGRETTTTIVDRAGERAIEAKDKFTEFVREHPIATVAGGLAIGILVSGLFKRSPTRKLGKRAATTAGSLAAIGAELAMSYAQQALEAANEAGKIGAEKLDELGSAAKSAGRGAAGQASDLGETARSVAKSAGKRLREAVDRRLN